MRLLFIAEIIIIGTLTSCYKVYDAKTDTDNKMLVVDGLITNKPETYNVILSYAEPLNSIVAYEPARNATVFVSDETGNQFMFHEKTEGNYLSDSLQFTGQPGKSYRLHIITMEGDEYESDSQRLFPEVSPESVYGEFDTKETLDQRTGLSVLTHGAEIFTDIPNNTDTLPCLRVVSNLVTQYFYLTCPYKQPCISFYCWQTTNMDFDNNIIYDEYSINSSGIRKHPVCFIDNNSDCYGLYYSYKIIDPYTQYDVIETHQYKYYMVHHRIIYLDLYTLNNESYLYYKSLNEQIQSQGKIFDPVATQLNGNIRCKSNPVKKAAGFFEASSVCNSSFTVDFRNLNNSQPSILQIPYVLPPESIGCRINNPPAFWVL